jgi:hypothetical protein
VKLEIKLPQLPANAARELKQLGFRGDQLWYLIAFESLVWATAVYFLAQTFVERPFAFAVVAFSLGFVFVVLTYVYMRRKPPDLSPDTIREFLNCTLGRNEPPTSLPTTVVLEATRATELLVSGLSEGKPYRIPHVSALDVAYEVIEQRAKKLVAKQGTRHRRGRIIARALHVIPAGRSESYWWKTPRGNEYFKLQRNLIRQGLLSVQRIFVTETDEPVPFDEFNEWLAQKQAGMDVRWASAVADFVSPNGVRDYLIVQVQDADGRTISHDVILEHRDGEHGAGFTEYASTELSPSDVNTSLVDDFDRYWIGLAPFDIPAVWKQGVVGTGADDPVTPGVLAFYTALQHIADAQEYIRAVDVSDLKEGLQAIYGNSAYKSWYEATIRRLETVGMLHRVFILRRRAESVETFLREHLPSYFTPEGKLRPCCKIEVIFEDQLRAALVDWPTHDMRRWLDDRAELVAHLKRANQWHHDIRQVMETVMRRDFLLTERIMYDYRADKAAFDFSTLADFLVILPTPNAPLLRQWCDVLALLSDRVPSVCMDTAEQFTTALRAAVTPAAGPGTAEAP